MLKPFFAQFFAFRPAHLHLAAHSHHPWPDLALQAHQEYAIDSIRAADHKWDKIFGQVLPEAQQHVVRQLGCDLADADRVTFAPNTAEFVARLYSAFEHVKAPIRVLTTDGEFHSFARITRRLEEVGKVTVTRVPVRPFATLNERLAESVRASKKSAPYDLIFFSHVLFESGYAIDPDFVLQACPEQSVIVLDGYHAFMARPINHRPLADRAFYMAGGYKYAMAGEGACWLYVPPAGDGLCPTNTGWFSDFVGLSGTQDRPVAYGPRGMRFFGATFDASGLYRFNAVQHWLSAQAIDTAAIHRHAHTLQGTFIDQLTANTALDQALARHHMLPLTTPRGNFCTFEMPDESQAVRLEAAIKAADVYIDRRDRRLRFGWGVYHDASDVDIAVERLSKAVSPSV
jgi:kynureninase